VKRRNKPGLPVVPVSLQTCPFRRLGRFHRVVFGLSEISVVWSHIHSESGTNSLVHVVLPLGSEHKRFQPSGININLVRLHQAYPMMLLPTMS